MLAVNFHPFPELHTERLLLRKMEEADAESFFRMRSDKVVMRHIGKAPMKSISEALDFVKLVNDLVQNNSGITWAMALIDKPQNLIGTIALWRIIKEHYRAEIGYMLLPEYWRQGLMKEAILKVIRYGFDVINLHSIEGHITPLNIASANILESTGFVREAYFKEDFFFNGRFEDTAVYSLLNK